MPRPPPASLAHTGSKGRRLERPRPRPLRTLDGRDFDAHRSWKFSLPEELKAALQKLADADKSKLGPNIQIVLEDHVAAKKLSKRK
jgi:hypothetical protein